jgi:putative transposase
MVAGKSHVKDGRPADRELLRTIERLAADSAGQIERSISLIYRELPSYTAVPVSSLQASVQRNLNIALRALRSGVEPAPADLPEAEITVRERAKQGVPIEDMMRAYRINFGVIQSRFLDLASAAGVPPQVVLDQARLLWEVSDAFTTRVALVYQELSVESALHDAHRRSDFVRALLAGTVDHAELVRACALFGLDPGASYFAIRARPSSGHAVEEMRRRLEREGSLPRKPALVGVLGGDCAGVVVRRPAAEGPWVLGMGAEVPLAEIAESFRTASRVVDLARRLGGVGVFRLEDMSWRLAAADDDEVGRHLVHRYLLPLRANGEFGQLVEDTVRAYLANGLSIKRTAAALVIHVNTLRYRLQKFGDMTGASLSSTDVIVELAWALEVGRLSAKE